MDENRVILSRIGTPPQKGSKALYVSLAEMVTSAGKAGLVCRLGEQIRISTLDRSGSAVIRMASGQVTKASGTLASLRGHRLRRIKRAQGARPFLTPAGIDFLISTSWLPAIFPKARDNVVLPIYPPVLDPRGDVPADSNVQSTHFGTVAVTMDGLRITLSNVMIARYDFEKNFKYFLFFSGVFTNISSTSIMVQPALLRPLTEGALASEGPAGWPLGRASLPSGGFGVIPQRYQGFKMSSSEEFGPTRILPPGGAGSFSQVRLPLTIAKLTKLGETPLVFSYDDGYRRLTISMFAQRKGAT